jgi:hypothetical protein
VSTCCGEVEVVCVYFLTLVDLLIIAVEEGEEEEEVLLQQI